MSNELTAQDNLDNEMEENKVESADALKTAAIDPALVTTRNFRNNPDVENFYRFVHDNSLRHEAKVLIHLVLEKTGRIKKKGRNKNLH